MVDSRTLLEAVRTTVKLEKSKIDEILNANLFSKERSTKVVHLLWKKFNKSLYVMLAERYRPAGNCYHCSTVKVFVLSLSTLLLNSHFYMLL